MIVRSTILDALGTESPLVCSMRAEILKPEGSRLGRGARGLDCSMLAGYRGGREGGLLRFKVLGDKLCLFSGAYRRLITVLSMVTGVKCHPPFR
jgi:hypothetical protein